MLKMLLVCTELFKDYYDTQGSITLQRKGNCYLGRKSEPVLFRECLGLFFKLFSSMKHTQKFTSERDKLTSDEGTLTPSVSTGHSRRATSLHCALDSHIELYLLGGSVVPFWNAVLRVVRNYCKLVLYQLVFRGDSCANKELPLQILGSFNSRICPRLLQHVINCKNHLIFSIF